MQVVRIDFNTIINNLTALRYQTKWWREKKNTRTICVFFSICAAQLCREQIYDEKDNSAAGTIR